VLTDELVAEMLKTRKDIDETKFDEIENEED
jgi:hypothetical protein